MRPLLLAALLSALPAAATPGRYQVVQIAPGRAVLVDTQTGATWETCDAGWCALRGGPAGESFDAMVARKRAQKAATGPSTPPPPAPPASPGP